MKKIVILFFLFSAFLFSQTDYSSRESLFSQASNLYASEKYNQALNGFEQLYNTGEISFELLYNMGNTYYRLGQIGKAIQFWEKALKLNPRHPDILHNLELARLKIQDKVILPKGFFLFEWYWSLRNSLPQAGLVFMSGLFFALFIFFIFLPKSIVLPDSFRYHFKRYTSLAKYIILLLFLGSLFVTADKFRFDKQNHYAIVTDNELKVKGEPQEASNVLFILHNGSKVKVISHLGEYTKISYFDDKIGWVKESSIGEI